MANFCVNFVIGSEIQEKLAAGQWAGCPVGIEYDPCPTTLTPQGNKLGFCALRCMTLLPEAPVHLGPAE